MQLYQTKIKNLIKLLPEHLWDKEVHKDVLLINEFFVSGNTLKNNLANHILNVFHNIHRIDETLIILNPEKKNDILKMAQKNYEEEQLNTLINLNAQLYQEHDIFINSDLSMDRQNMTSLLAQYISWGEDFEVSFWADFDPNFLQNPFEAFPVSTNESYSEAKYNSLINSHFGAFIPKTEKQVINKIHYPHLDDEQYNIFNAAQIDVTDIEGVEIILDRIINIPDVISEYDKKEWIRFLHITNEEKESFSNNFGLDTVNYKKTANQYQNKVLLNALNKLPVETLQHPLIASKIFQPSYANLSSTNNEDIRLLFGNKNIFDLLVKVDVFNNPTILSELQKCYGSEPSNFLDAEEFKSSMKTKNHLQFSYENSFYKPFLESIVKLPYGEFSPIYKKNITNSLLTNAKDYIKETFKPEDKISDNIFKPFIEYFQKYIAETELNITSSPEGVNAELEKLEMAKLDSFILGFPFFSNEFKQNSDVVSFISKHLFDITKGSPYNHESLVVQAIVKCYDLDFLFKNKKLVPIKNSFFSLDSPNPDHAGNTSHKELLKLHTYFIAKEINNFIKDGKLSNFDIMYMRNQMSKMNKTSIPLKIDYLVKTFQSELPYLKDIDSESTFTSKIPYLSACFKTLKENTNDLPTVDVNNICESIMNFSTIICLYSHEKNPKIMDTNPIGLTFENLKEFRPILAMVADIVIVNKALLSELDINNPVHHNYFEELISKINKEGAIKLTHNAHAKPFFMLDNVIKSLESSTKLLSFHNDKLSLGHLYSNDDVKELFQRYGKDNHTWFMFCPDTFLGKAPLEYKQDINMWVTMFKKYEYNIFPYMPNNLKFNSDVMIKFLETKPKLSEQTLNTFPDSIKNNIKSIQYVFKNFPEISQRSYPNLVQYLNKASSAGSNVPLITKFNMVFEEQLLTQANPPTKENQPKARAKKF